MSLIVAGFRRSGEGGGVLLHALAATARPAIHIHVSFFIGTRYYFKERSGIYQIRACMYDPRAIKNGSKF